MKRISCSAVNEKSSRSITACCCFDILPSFSIFFIFRRSFCVKTLPSPPFSTFLGDCEFSTSSDTTCTSFISCWMRFVDSMDDWAFFAILL